MLSLITSWLTTLSLVFGGCCSNALTLEQITLQHPHAGSLLTFFQFLLISLYGLPKFVVWTRYGPRFRPTRVPIAQYVLQVGTFYFVNLLNNAAFAYQIPMSVHIIFRSGGLVVSLIMGWLMVGRRYTTAQIASVLIVTIGVILTTLSASNPTDSFTGIRQAKTYATGIGILTLALVLSGFLGIRQDRVAETYLRNQPAPAHGSAPPPYQPPAWQESMFYLHFLALPMFTPLIPNIMEKMGQFNAAPGPRFGLNVPLPFAPSSNLTSTYPMGLVPPYSLPFKLPVHFFPASGHNSIVSLTQQQAPSSSLLLSLSVPQIYFPLILNTITQLICVAGVHRLTTRVSALTVTLVLVVRKAVSLIISVVGIEKVVKGVRSGLPHSPGLGIVDELLVYLGRAVDGLVVAMVGGEEVMKKKSEKGGGVDMRLMWIGASMVLLGTVGYTLGTNRGQKTKTTTNTDNVKPVGAKDKIE